jgi:hypothetical protein
MKNPERLRIRGPMAVTALLLGVAACSAAGPASTPTDQPDALATASSRSSSPSAGPTTRRVQGTVLAEGTFPSFSVEVPNGWSSLGQFIVKNSTDVIGLSVWDVSEVPSDPCHWSNSLTDPGPTVADLVESLMAQKTRNATPPRAVELAGYSGVYLEWSVPEDAVVTGDADFEGCDTWPENGHQDFVSWLSTGDGERYQQVPGQMDWLWVLDVDGQRLVVDATHTPSSSEEDIAQLRQVADSLSFQAP